MYNPEEHVSENVIIKGYVSNILERDREDAKAGLQVYLLEQERYFPVEVPGIGTIQTGGKIDRLDIYGAPGNETLRIVDYKSGGCNDKTHAEKMSAKWDELMDAEENESNSIRPYDEEQILELIRRTQNLENQRTSLYGAILIVMGIALLTLSFVVGGSNLRDFCSGILLGLSIVEMLAGVYMLARGFSKQQ